MRGIYYATLELLGGVIYPRIEVEGIDDEVGIFFVCVIMPVPYTNIMASLIDIYYIFQSLRVCPSHNTTVTG
jgi:hypothetical protein